MSKEPPSRPSVSAHQQTYHNDCNKCAGTSQINIKLNNQFGFYAIVLTKQPVNELIETIIGCSQLHSHLFQDIQ